MVLTGADEQAINAYFFELDNNGKGLLDIVRNVIIAGAVANDLPVAIWQCLDENSPTFEADVRANCRACGVNLEPYQNIIRDWRLAVQRPGAVTNPAGKVVQLTHAAMAAGTPVEDQIELVKKALLAPGLIAQNTIDLARPEYSWFLMTGGWQGGNSEPHGNVLVHKLYQRMEAAKHITLKAAIGKGEAAFRQYMAKRVREANEANLPTLAAAILAIVQPLDEECQGVWTLFKTYLLVWLQDRAGVWLKHPFDSDILARVLLENQARSFKSTSEENFASSMKSGMQNFTQAANGWQGKYGEWTEQLAKSMRDVQDQLGRLPASGQAPIMPGQTHTAPTQWTQPQFVGHPYPSYPGYGYGQGGQAMVPAAMAPTPPPPPPMHGMTQMGPPGQPLAQTPSWYAPHPPAYQGGQAHVPWYGHNGQAPPGTGAPRLAQIPGSAEYTGCKICGSKTHLAANCPDKVKVKSE